METETQKLSSLPYNSSLRLEPHLRPKLRSKSLRYLENTPAHYEQVFIKRKGFLANKSLGYLPQKFKSSCEKEILVIFFSRLPQCLMSNDNFLKILFLLQIFFNVPSIEFVGGSIN